ncbi:MAG: hypothetical protein HY762_06465 [Planctomycetes bacterium]|nr:hypothetical protein [Planctomycetota bacterium]
MKKLLTVSNLIIVTALPIISIVSYLGVVSDLSGEFHPFNSQEHSEYLKQKYIDLLWIYVPCFIIIFWLSFASIVFGIARCTKHILFLPVGLTAGWPFISALLINLVNLLIPIDIGAMGTMAALFVLTAGFIISLIYFILSQLLKSKFPDGFANFSVFGIGLNVAWILLVLTCFQALFDLFGD